ncbi:MAG: DegT/DnrJ/EryC1/StrS family aminotransferase [Clostridia bacterium]|nr:DegT/DnrJ/EryC1/StrS family aminotransferase [Clostridia bacterium]
MKQINVTHSSMPSYEEYCEEIKQIWDSVHLTNMGPIHNELKDKIKAYLKVNNIELFTNGHLALYVAIKALGLKGEIITTPFTFASTTNAIIQAGCKPVFCDVKDDYTIDETKIESLITKDTVAILGVHVYGNICDVDKIQKIADKYNLKVIYDAAHAFGVTYNGKGIGSYGDVSMFSFHATKVFHTIEGGCITYKDSSLTSKIMLQRNFGCNGDTLECTGTNAKMNEFQAAMGICNLRHINEEIASRKEVYEKYVSILSNVKGIKLLKYHDGLELNYAYFPILVDKELFGEDRDALAKRLGENNVFARKYFFPLTSENKDINADTTKTPKAYSFSRNVLCLPMYAHLDLNDVETICNYILKCKKN